MTRSRLIPIRETLCKLFPTAFLHQLARTTGAVKRQRRGRPEGPALGRGAWFRRRAGAHPGGLAGRLREEHGTEDRGEQLQLLSSVSTLKGTSMPSNWMCGQTDSLQRYRPISPSTGVTSMSYALNG